MQNEHLTPSQINDNSMSFFIVFTTRSADAEKNKILELKKEQYTLIQYNMQTFLKLYKTKYVRNKCCLFVNYIGHMIDDKSLYFTTK